MNAGDEWEAAFLNQARAGLEPSDEGRRRQLARVESSLAAGLPPTFGIDSALGEGALSAHVARATAPHSGAMTWVWKAHPLALVGSGLLVGGVVGLLVGRGTQLPKQPGKTTVPEPLPAAVLQEPVLTPEPTPAPTPKPSDLPKDEAPDDAVRAPHQGAPRAAEKEVPAEPTFYEELSYLRRAQAALRKGQPALALGIMTSLDDIQKVGALDIERRVTKALALCDLGRIAEAKTVSAPILKKQDDSVYAKRLNESCVGAASSKTSEKTE